jgi:hypothetical protein
MFHSGEFMNELSKHLVRLCFSLSSPSSPSSSLPLPPHPRLFVLIPNTQIAEQPDMIAFFVMSNVNFFKSEWKEIKANAGIFTGESSLSIFFTHTHTLSLSLSLSLTPSITFSLQPGFLLGNLPIDQRKLITKEHVCGGE